MDRIKLKKLIEQIDNVSGDGTSMVTLIIPAGSNDQLNHANALLTNEYGTASNIKSRVNRLSVLEAITRAQGRLKYYKKLPENGLCIFASGQALFDIVPFRPIQKKMYLCDSVFHTEYLKELLIDDKDTYGFLILDGNGFLIATLNGSTKTILYDESVSLPRKHNKGGQSSVRFARLRRESIHNYLMKVGSVVTKTLIKNDASVVKFLIIAGAGNLKDEVIIDPRIKVERKIEVSYGSQSGLYQAIKDSSDILVNSTLRDEIAILQKFMTLLATDSGMVVYGPKNTKDMFEEGLIDELIVNDTNSDVIYFSENESKVNKIHVVTANSGEGMQFLKGFGGLAGILRYRIETRETFEEIEEDEEFYDDDF